RSPRVWPLFRRNRAKSIGETGIRQPWGGSHRKRKGGASFRPRPGGGKPPQRGLHRANGKRVHPARHFSSPAPNILLEQTLSPGADAPDIAESLFAGRNR